MRALVLGGSGMLGHQLCQYLWKSVVRNIPLDNLNRSKLSSGFCLCFASNA